VAPLTNRRGGYKPEVRGKKGVSAMQTFTMYMCDSCGHGQTVSGMCPNCETVLTTYTKESQAEYQVDKQIEDAMLLNHPRQWYL
jgi:hypothetical protein